MTSILLLVFVGCSDGKNDFNLIASVNTLPDNFHEIAVVRKSPPNYRYLVKKASNQSEYEETWNFFGLEDKMPDVEFNDSAVFFIGVIESGSCPYKIKTVEISSDNKTITVPLSEPKDVCTSDGEPRTFVIGIDKEKSKVITNMVIVQSQSGVETNIPLAN